MTLNVGLNIIRFNLPDYQANNSTQDLLTWIYIPIMLVSYLLEVGMIFYFYDTGMKFVKILHKEEEISLNKARGLFGYVLVFLIIGKWDYYVDELLIQVNQVLLENKICTTIK